MRRTRGFFRTTLPRLITAVVGVVISIPPVSAEEPAENFEPRVEQLIAELMLEHGIPGLSVAVARENELCFSRGFGQANVEHSAPATTYTRYRTASVAKPMTAVVVMALVEEGMIDLDAAVQEYCAAYPEKEWPVTCRQLLGHLGGVRHYRDQAETLSTAHYFSLDAALRTFADDPLLHEPETKFHYTTFGYNLLGSVAEGAGGRSFVELLNERVVVPAGMRHTVADDHYALIPGRASGYIRATGRILERLPAGHTLVEGALYNAPPHDTSVKIPGGGLLSTAADLVRFAIAVNTGDLLCHDTVQQMWTVQQTADGEETGYGLGWRVGEHSGRTVVSHTGGQAGTSTVLFIVPETGVVVAILCNLQYAPLSDAAATIADVIASQEPTTAPAGSCPPPVRPGP